MYRIMVTNNKTLQVTNYKQVSALLMYMLHSAELVC
jgi:hypothetical protein